jgi:hypothetical protein
MLEMERIGFKEWAVICEAVGRGRQSIIIRKGGIAEGREGFSFKHSDFFLFPTWFHEQPDKVRHLDGIEMPAQNEREIEIRYFAKIEDVRVISSWKTVEALAPLHFWKTEVIRERFDYDESPGVHVAFVRVFRLQPAWTIANEKRFGGCRSWVDLPEPALLRLPPVLSDAEHERRRKEFASVVAN